MSKRKKMLAFALVMILIVSSMAACMPQPARRPIQNYPTNHRNYNTGMNTPYTAQNYPKNVGSGTNTSPNGQISSLFSKLDYSYATITDNINIRTGPAATTPTAGNLKKGDVVKVVGKLNGWYVVNVPNTNKLGCISPGYADLYSAKPGTTTPEPKKPIPTTPAPTTPTTPTTPTAPGTPTTPTTPTAPGTTPAATGSGTLSAQGSRILQLANAERAKIGAKPLKSNSELNKLATMKSQDIVEKNYFSHQSPTYGSPFDMMKTYGISYMYAGENLAINSDADKAHNAWMNSEGHRKNILNPDFTEIGIGLYPKGNGSYAYTQMFIGK